MGLASLPDLPALLLASARVLPLGIALAVFSRGLVPAAVALSASLALGVALAPAAGALSAALGPLGLGLALLRELGIGAAFALAVSLALLVVPWTLAIAHPALPPALAGAYGRYACWLVLALGAPRALLVGLAESYRDAPVAAQALDARTFALGVAQLTTDALLTALGVGLPVWLAALTFELALAVAGRAVALPRQPLALLRPLLLTVLAALLLVPVASRAPELLRAALAAARTLTRALVQ